MQVVEISTVFRPSSVPILLSVMSFTSLSSSVFAARMCLFLTRAFDESNALVLFS